MSWEEWGTFWTSFSASLPSVEEEEDAVVVAVVMLPVSPPFLLPPLSAEDRGEEDNFINHRGVGGTTTEERGFPKYWLRGGGGGGRRSSKVAPSFSSVAGLDFLDLALPPSLPPSLPQRRLRFYIYRKSRFARWEMKVLSLSVRSNNIRWGGEVSDQRGFFPLETFLPRFVSIGEMDVLAYRRRRAAPRWSPFGTLARLPRRRSGTGRRC